MTQAELLAANDALFTTNGTNDIEGIEVNTFIENLINSIWAEFGNAADVKLNLKGYANFADITTRTILKGDTFINYSPDISQLPDDTYLGDWIVALDSGEEDFSGVTPGVTNSLWFYFPFGKLGTIELIRAAFEALTTTNRLNKSAIQGGEYALNKRGTGDVYNASYKGASMQNRLKGDFWIVAAPGSPEGGDTSSLLSGDWVVAVKDAADYSNYSDTAEWLILRGFEKVRTTEIKTDSSAATDLTVNCGTDKTILLGETVWDDVMYTPTAMDFGGANDPTLVNYTPSGSGAICKLYEFAKNDIAYFTVQLPHRYKTGTDIYVHVHWTPGSRGTAESEKFVGWKVQYSWASIGGTFGAMATADCSDQCDGENHKHQMSPDIQITGTNKGISSILVCAIKRTDTGTDDDWAGTVSGQLPLLLGVDFHIEIDTMGSRQKGVK